MTSNEPVPFRPLGILKMLLETIGFEVTHCYEDLVFIEHNALLLRMEAKGEEIEELLKNAGKTHNLVISCSGTYQMTPNETDGTIDIEFLD